MTMHVGQDLHLDVVKPVLGGDGLARHEGMAVFVAGTLPGQRVLARINAVKARHARAEVIEVLEQSPEYEPPVCPHFGVCGGCDWLHMEYGRQLHWKRELVQETLRHLAAAEVQVAPTIASPRIHGYRNKMEFAAARSIVTGANANTQGRAVASSGMAVGLRPRGLANAVVPIQSCALCPQDMVDAANVIGDWAVNTGLEAYDPDTGHGFWRHMVLRQGANPEHLMVSLITGNDPRGKEVGPVLAEQLAKRLAHHSLRTFSVVHETRGSRTLVAQGERVMSVTGPEGLRHNLGDLELTMSSRAFFQVNSGAAEKLCQVVADFGELRGRETVWDLYSGVGVMALSLAGQAARVVGFETVSQAVRDAQDNARRNAVSNCRFVVGDVSRTIPRMLGDGSAKPPDLVVADPPRAGMQADVVARLLEIDAPKLILVSCDPATLARDVKRLSPGYELLRVQPVDMFPQTSHIECIAELRSR